MDETNKAATPATARNPIGTAKAGWLSKLARYIDAAGNTVEGRQLAHLRKLVNGIDTGTLSGGQNAETEFKQAVHRAIDASGDETVYHNALRLIAFYNKNPPITKEEQHARAKAFHEAEQAAKAKAEQAKADRIYLTVPFADKDKMKSKGAKWDGDRKKWYWPTSAGDMPAVVKGYAK